MSTLSFDSKLDFGKHEGKTVGEMLTENPSYLMFLRRPGANSKIKFTMDVHCALDAMLYAVGFSATSADKPRYPQEVSDGWLRQQAARVERERQEALAEQARAQVERQKAAESGNSTYDAWGAW